MKIKEVKKIKKTDKYSFIKGKLLSSRVYPEFFPLNQNDKVINIGSGWGPQAIVYSGQYREMIGVDINKERLEKSKEIAKYYKINNFSTLLADVESIPLPAENFDKVLAIDIIEHVKNPNKLVQEAYRLLKPKG